MDDIWQLIRWAHLLAMAFFVGGQLVIAAAVMPAARRSPDADVVRRIGRRFGIASAGAGMLLLATGIALAGRDGHWDDPTLQVKLALVAALVGLVVWHVRRPAWHALAAATLLVSLAIVWLGVDLAHG